MNKLLMGACLTMAMQVGHSQTLPQLGKDPIEKIVAAMTAEEKVSLLVGTGMRRPISRSRQHAKYSAGSRRNDLPDRTSGNPRYRSGRRSRRITYLPDSRGERGDLLLHGIPGRYLASLHMEHRIGQKRRQRHGRRGERIRLRRTLGPRAEYPPKPSLRT